MRVKSVLNRKRTFLLCLISVSVSAFLPIAIHPCSAAGAEDKNADRFIHRVVDQAGLNDPWGKSVGDINGDGMPDIVIGAHKPPNATFWERLLVKARLKKAPVLKGELVWYENPDWTKHLVYAKDRFRTDHEVADIDNDGHNDIIALGDEGMAWFKNPDWSRSIIDPQKLHDVEVADLDGDGDIDIIARNQSLFNYSDGNQLHFYRQDSPDTWERFTIAVPHGEGLKLADMDSDGRMDVVVNGFWYQNPGRLSADKDWPSHAYRTDWDLADVFIDTADVDDDGIMDIVLAPAEEKGGRYRISWMKGPASVGGKWQEVVVDPDVETVHHSVHARDFDNDGDIDILSAEMDQGDTPNQVKVYWNSDAGRTWTKQVVSEHGSHSMRAVDIDGDGDIDFFGADVFGKNRPVELWLNRTYHGSMANWKRHEIDSETPWRCVFITAADMDADGFRDIVTGGWWYRNPGTASARWERHQIGTPARNAALVKDIDGDGDNDIIASVWRDTVKPSFFGRVLRKLGLSEKIEGKLSGRLVWAENDGKGNFNVFSNIPDAGGDFLQGVAAVTDQKGTDIMLSWHKAGFGVQSISIPEHPKTEAWPRRVISEMSQDEDLDAGDIDGDGDTDILLGTTWLRHEGNGAWTLQTLHQDTQKPDRNALVDMNGDGKLDAVIGYEAISVPGKIAWYEQKDRATDPWVEHQVDTVVGPMSVDVIDMDNDGDWDIVVGEHNLAKPGKARMLMYENIDIQSNQWRRHLVGQGDEHHDGAQAVDIDNDGDVDILSIGWGHRKVILYENLTAKDR